MSAHHSQDITLERGANTYGGLLTAHILAISNGQLLMGQYPCKELVVFKTNGSNVITIGLCCDDATWTSSGSIVCSSNKKKK